MADASSFHSQEASAPVESASNQGSRATQRQLKPILIKPEVEPKKGFVDFYTPIEGGS